MAAKGVRVNVSGAAELRAAARSAQDSVRVELEAALAAEAQAVADDARSNVRVDSGDLRNSIEAQTDGMTASVAPRSGLLDGPYEKAMVNEFGRSSDPGQPFMVPAAEASRKRWPQRAAEAVKRGAGSA